MEHTYRLVISCPDRVGIVAKVSNFLSTYNGWITEASHHSDTQTGWFFMRHEIKATSIPFGLDQFRAAFEPIAREFNMNWHIADSAQPKKVILMCSKESHCVADLLHRWHSKEINAVVVLARYMQIIPGELCEKYSGKVINIHHSFLPSFAGARPYHQAYSRGVKLIGATCHYVTQDLDEGPIIEQDVIRITHSDSIEDMVRLGKDVEKNVLARGLRSHIEDRVITYENKTVVFD